MLQVTVDNQKMRELINFFVGDGGDVDLRDYCSTDGMVHMAAACLMMAGNVSIDTECWHDEIVFQSAVDAAEKLATVMMDQWGCKYPDDKVIDGMPKDGKLRLDEWARRRAEYSGPITVFHDPPKNWDEACEQMAEQCDRIYS
jgi:hypothetical protein